MPVSTSVKPFPCPTCTKHFTTRNGRKQHTRDVHQQSNLCSFCNKGFGSHGAKEQHDRAKHHGSRFCKPCNVVIPEQDWERHGTTAAHVRKANRDALKTSLKATETTLLSGIQVDKGEINFGSLDISSTGSYQMLILTNTEYPSIDVTPRITSSTLPGFFSVESAGLPRTLFRTNIGLFKISAGASNYNRGQIEGRLEIIIRIPTEKNRQFLLTRRITAHIGSVADANLFREAQSTATAVAVGRKRKRRRRQYTIFHPGVRPDLLAEIVWVRDLDLYEVPKALVDLLGSRARSFEKLNTLREEYMFGDFQPTTYAAHFQTMLWIEESRAQIELSDYDMDDVVLAKDGSQHILEVPGLAEKRPSVIRGDEFIVRGMNSEEMPFQGFCHAVEDKTIRLRFSDNFTITPGRKYEVEFKLNRLVFRRMHQALACTGMLDRIAFPQASDMPPVVTQSNLSTIEPHNRLIGQNDAQLKAVASIANMLPGSIPFIVYGPPGTGKTVTIVEAIRQILVKNPESRILACAPSNAAADVIASRLAVLGPNRLIRIVAPSRGRKLVDKTVLPFTRSNDRGNFTCPPVDELANFQVIVSTCCNASVPYGIGMSRGHFTHIFVDEAAQASEPEVMIPIRTMAGPETNIIISGDMKQLGPVIRSSLARELGLGKSFMERLMETEVYSEDSDIGRDRTFVKLVKNYRSHPKILEFPNSKFYRGELVACADSNKTERVVGRWSGLVNPRIPVVFHSVRGKDCRDKHSPSYFNADEISVVKEHLMSLLHSPQLNLHSKDIAIITPYRAQVSRIREHIKSFAEDTRVGSVEEFQGQESSVIIISTVRSSPDVIDFDLRHTLGFVASPRRFNVAVTRAQSLLIVIGDPIVLALDSLWKFINFVHINGCFKGSPIDWDPTEPVDHNANLVEERRARGLSEMEALIQRANEMDQADQEEEEHGQERGPVREET